MRLSTLRTGANDGPGRTRLCYMTEPSPTLVGTGIDSIPPNDLQERILRNEPVQVIDVREFPEYASGRIRSAKLVPLGQLESRANELDRRIPLVCVCRSGKRSAQAVKILSRLGFNDVRQLEGGMETWKNMGLPLTRDARAPWSLERQVRFVQGLLVVAGLALSLRWPAAVILAWFIGVGMMFTAVIDWCGLGTLMAKAPWNKAGGACGK